MKNLRLIVSCVSDASNNFYLCDCLNLIFATFPASKGCLLLPAKLGHCAVVHCIKACPPLKHGRMNSRADHSTVQDGNDGNADGGIRIFPRRKLHEGEQGAANSEPKPRGRPPLKLGLKAVESQFNLPQKDAAASFGISLTAFKQVCRKLGINRWPYRRQGKVIGVLNSHLRAPACHSVCGVWACGLR